MIELETTRPRLSVKVYPQWEIEGIVAPQGRFVVVSITDTDRRKALANLENLGSAPVLRLDFHVGGPPKGMTDEQAARFWDFHKKAICPDWTPCCCIAGAGAMRSPALALALSHAFYGGDFPVEADVEPDEAAYLAAVRAFPRVFDRPFPASDSETNWGQE